MTIIDPEIQMTADEILKNEIPEGIYKTSLGRLYSAIKNYKEVEKDGEKNIDQMDLLGLCHCFSVLYDKAIFERGD